MLCRCFLLLLVIIGSLSLSACDNSPRRVVLSGATMGTSWSVIYAQPDGKTSASGGPASAAELQDAIESELLAINQSLSTYIPDSEISKVNGIASGEPLVLSERFATVLDAALAIGKLTDGAYDVTVGPLVELWGFGASAREPVPPGAADIAQTMNLVGAKRLSWDVKSASLELPEGVSVDLSSIAKGYAVDRLSELLGARGITDSLVEIGGELRASGQRPEGGPWRLAVESPDPATSRFIDALSVTDAAVATSGDYRNFFEYQGKRYSHLVDPRTGYPVAHELVSVTVIDAQCMIADALATALLVLGLEAAQQLAEEEGLAAHFVSRVDEGLEVHYTPAFEVYRHKAQAGLEP